MRSMARRAVEERAGTRRSSVASALVVAMLCTGVVSQDSSEYTFRAKTEIVLVNVTVRDKNGNPVHDLKREDFTVSEDNKPQQVISFDQENTDAVLSTAATEAPLLRPAKPTGPMFIRAGDPSAKRPAAHHPVFRSQLHATR